MGSNFSKSGITKDLEAMKSMGIGGATIFNIASAVQESHVPTLNNPYPTQTYRSEAYWDAIKHAAAEAQRLGLEIGYTIQLVILQQAGLGLPKKKPCNVLFGQRWKWQVELK